MESDVLLGQLMLKMILFDVDAFAGDFHHVLICKWSRRCTRRRVLEVLSWKLGLKSVTSL